MNICGKKVPVPDLAENEKQKELKGKGRKPLLVYFTKINPGLDIKSKTYYLYKGLVINLYKDGIQNGIIFLFGTNLEGFFLYLWSTERLKFIYWNFRRDFETFYLKQSQMLCVKDTSWVREANSHAATKALQLNCRNHRRIHLHQVTPVLHSYWGWETPYLYVLCALKKCCS